MGRIPEETILQVRERVDIVELIGRYLSLKRSGVNNFGLCPFHGEKSPSFNVNSARQIFHCFGCGEGGNAITFLMKIEGLGFQEAVKRLAGEVGIELEEERISPEEEARRRELDKLQRINESVCQFYQEQLLTDAAGAVARKYLRGRGYDGEMARDFQLGYAPDRWEALSDYLKEKQLDAGLARQLGLIRPGKQGRGDYDLFRGRLIFPIFDHYGKVVAFGARTLGEDGPKYLNSPESPIYHKSRVLYGLYRAKEAMRRSDTAIVVEGYFDVLAMHRAGVTHTVASCGTALTREHAQILKRYAKKLVLLFDQDQAGISATLRAMEVALPEGLEVQTVVLDPGEDPDSFLARYGKEPFLQRIDQAASALDWFMDRQLESGVGVAGQARAVDEILQRINLLPGEIERSLYLQQLARRTGLAVEMLQRKTHRRPAEAPTRAAVPRSQETAPVRQEAPPLPAELMLLQLFLIEPELVAALPDLELQEVFLHPQALEIGRSLIELQGKDPAGLLDKEDWNAQQKAILSGILMKDRDVLGEDPGQALEDCRSSLRKERLKRQGQELTQQIAEAAKSGDQQLLAELNQQKQELSRRLKGPAGQS
jgi:DNA primase